MVYVDQVSNLKNLLKVILFLVLFSCIQEPLFVNLQLLFLNYELFPYLDYGINPYDVFFIIAASLFLIFHYKSFQSPEWWGGFLIMVIPYLVLKFFGVYGDISQYEIANYEGKAIGGGAAMAHLPLLLYLMGPAQVFSVLGFFAIKKRANVNSSYFDRKLIPMAVWMKFVGLPTMLIALCIVSIGPIRHYWLNQQELYRQKGVVDSFCSLFKFGEAVIQLQTQELTMMVSPGKDQIGPYEAHTYYNYNYACDVYVRDGKVFFKSTRKTSR